MTRQKIWRFRFSTLDRAKCAVNETTAMMKDQLSWKTTHSGHFSVTEDWRCHQRHLSWETTFFVQWMISQDSFYCMSTMFYTTQWSDKSVYTYAGAEPAISITVFDPQFQAALTWTPVLLYRSLCVWQIEIDYPSLTFSRKFSHCFICI